MTTTDGEILVHISTPATPQNDDLYRSLAQAYLDFEPHISAHGAEYQPDTRLASFSQQWAESTPLNGPEQHAAESSMPSTSNESYGSFPSQLSSGGRDEGGSRLARLDRLHMRWKDQTTPKPSSSKGSRGTRNSLNLLSDADTAFIDDTQLGARALQSQLQDSSSTTDQDTSDGESEAHVLVLPAQGTPSRQASQASQTSPQPAPSQPCALPKSKSDDGTHKASLIHAGQTSNGSNGVKMHAPLQAGSASGNVDDSARKRHVPREPIVQDAPISIPRAPQRTQDRADNIDQTGLDFSKLALDAYPPPPKISVERPRRLPSQITKHLAALKAQNPKRFRTSQKNRTPKADERGYWSVTCAGWPQKLQHEFWISVCEHVEGGRLGWGVSLHRDVSSPPGLGQVRLYCWAEVAEHTWLILWLCSKGQVAGSQSRWIDADGNVVFEVA